AGDGPGGDGQVAAAEDAAEVALLVVLDDDLGGAGLADEVARRGGDVHRDRRGGAGIGVAVGRGHSLGARGGAAAGVGDVVAVVVLELVSGGGEGGGVGGRLGVSPLVQQHAAVQRDGHDAHQDSHAQGHEDRDRPAATALDREGSYAQHDGPLLCSVGHG